MLQCYHIKSIEQHLEVSKRLKLSCTNGFINYSNTYLDGKYNTKNFIAWLEHSETKMNYGDCWSHISEVIEAYGLSGDSAKILEKLKTREYAEKVYFINDGSFRNNVILGQLRETKNGYVYEVSINILNESKLDVPSTPIRRLKWVKDNFEKIFVLLPSWENEIRSLSIDKYI